ncbi:MAG: FAD-binding oxidoreductase [Pseudomonadota bacterium]
MASTSPTTGPLSLWDASAAESDYCNAEAGEITTDLAIVGGGFTGLSTALHAAQRGIACHVIEARQIGFGGSGRNVGLLNAGLWLPPPHIAKELGEERASRLVGILGEAPAYVFDLIEKHQIRCEARRNGTIHAAHAPSGMADLKGRFEAWKSLNAPVRLLDRDEASERIGTQAFYGGLHDARAGTINPMGYVRGLARAARAAGASIATGVRVTALTRETGRWLLTTDAGPVNARMVVLGTNAYTDALWPGLSKTFTIIHYFNFATEPLGDRAAHILPGHEGVWDTAPIMSSVRRDNGGRLIVGSMGTVIGGMNGLSARWARKTIARWFPELGVPSFEAAWHGQIAFTPDHIPRIHRLADNLYTPIGYNGRGIAPGTVFGRAMAGLAAGEPEGELPLAITDMVPDRRSGLMKQAYQAAFIANQIRKAI